MKKGLKSGRRMGIYGSRLIICSLLLLIISTSTAFAHKFAYIPILRANGLVYVVDTSTVIPEIITSLSAHNPTGVAINSDGSKVYVTQRYLDKEGDVIIIDALKNEIIATKIENIGLIQPASLVFHPDTNALFVTHNNGITKINLDSDGLPTGVTSILTAEYNSGEIDYFGDYIFSTGVKYDDAKNPFDSGVSMFRASTEEQVGEISLDNVGTIGLGLDPGSSRLYISNRTNDTISVIKVSTSGLLLEETIQLAEGSAPYGLAYDSNYQRLYIANSATTGGFEDLSTGVGGKLASVELKGDNRIPEYHALSITENRYALDTSLHPLALNYDAENRELFVIKDLWLSINGGTYLSVITNGLGGLDLESEIHIEIDSRNKPQFSGRFLGPECSACPTLNSSQPTTIIRRNSIVPSTLLIIFVLLLITRRFENKIASIHSR